MTFTHDIMGQMLGVSRSRVSLAAGALQKKGLIYYLRRLPDDQPDDRLFPPA
jgi:hypothetical protein